MCESGRMERNVSSERAMRVSWHEVTLAMMLPCESITPFGRPEVPEVKQIVASVVSGSAWKTGALAVAGSNAATEGKSSPESGRKTWSGGKDVLHRDSACAMPELSTIRLRASAVPTHHTTFS